MKKRLRMQYTRSFLALVLVSFIALPASAQLPGVSVGLGVGPSFPTGDLGDVADPGFHVQGVFDVSLPLIPFGVRANADFHQMSTIADGNARQLFVNVNGVVDVPLVPLLLSGYFTAGPGMYHSRFSTSVFNGSDSSTNFGLNAGAGVQLSLVLIDLFLEARYHHAFGDDSGISFVPVTVGILF